jgi:hypothetical protein
MGEEERHHDDARPKDEDVLGFFQVEIADAAHEQIGDGEVEEPPEDIDPRRRQTYPGRGRKGALEGMSRDAVSEMGQRVGEEGSPEKVGKVVIPAHSALDCGADAWAVNGQLPASDSRAAWNLFHRPFPNACGFTSPGTKIQPSIGL